MRVLQPIIALLFLLSCSGNQNDGDDIGAKSLAGTWNIADSERYEAWEVTGRNSMIGYSYKRENGRETVSETLAIKWEDDRILYEATVPDQNKGETITFVLNREISALLSFENLTHDFPKKIQYRFITADSLEVNILGDQDEGFSYVMFKKP